MYFIVLLLVTDWRSRRRGPTQRAVSGYPCVLLASAGSFFRSRVEKKLANFAGHIAHDGSLLRPCQRLVHIGAFQNPETANVLLGLGVGPIGDEHLAVGLLPQRLRVGGRGNSAGELP